MLQTGTDWEIPYSPKLEEAFKVILQDARLSEGLNKSSFQFLRAARFIKKNAPHLFRVREMGAQPENPMDRWLWDLLK